MNNKIADRSIFVLMWALVAVPLLLFVVSPNRWRYAAALENQKSGQLKLAVEQFRKITESDPQNVGAWFRLSEIALEQKDYQESVSCIDQALRCRLLKLSLERNDYQKSLQCLNGPIDTMDLSTYDEQAYRIVDQKITSLLASDKGEQAVALINQQLTGLVHLSGKKGAAFSDLSPKDVNDLSAVPFFQNQFNKLAYLSAVANLELNQAAQLIDGVLFAFQRREVSRLLLPYLHELNRDYLKAQNAYADILFETKNAMPPLDGLSSFLKKQFEIDIQAEPTVNLGQTKNRFKVLHRMKIIAEKLSQKQCVAQIDDLLKGLPEQEKQEYSLELIIDRADIFEQASSLCSYLDTRAFVRYRQATKLENEMVRAVEQDMVRVATLTAKPGRGITRLNFFLSDVARFKAINSLYSKALSDIESTIELHEAIEKFRGIQPLNSLVVRRSTDEIVATRRQEKNSAVMYFHYSLILESNERFTEAVSARKKVGELGFEIDELLF